MVLRDRKTTVDLGISMVGEDERLPLDEILGRPANVAVLRAIVGVLGSIFPAELADLARLSREGTWKAIYRLHAHGLLEPVGTRRSIPWRLHRHNPLIPPLVDLFDRECRRYRRYRPP